MGQNAKKRTVNQIKRWGGEEDEDDEAAGKDKS